MVMAVDLDLRCQPLFYSGRYQRKLLFGNEYVTSGTCSLRYTY